VAIDTIIKPVATALVKEGKSFCGVLFAGLIKTNDGPKVIEFNARFGDPETQVVLPRMKSDLFSVLQQILKGERPAIEWEDRAMLGVVLASKGYPESYETGRVISGLSTLERDTYVFHAGTLKSDEGEWLSNGGRILLVGAKGNSIKEAKEKVYGELEKIESDGVFYRTDIGSRAGK
ncbi:MAG: phosphoribosylglycinamide synthetase C domain-containing protein, partial [Bacillota bacterium]|nr:phosphoribosylglycinamide synthetase C domain-containing protein [Bacillota bacterium]